MTSREQKQEEVLDLAKDALQYEQQRKLLGKETADSLYRTRHGIEGAAYAIVGIATIIPILGEMLRFVFVHPAKSWFFWMAVGALWISLSSFGRPEWREPSSGFLLPAVPGAICLMVFLYHEVFKKFGALCFRPGKIPFNIGAALLFSPLAAMMLIAGPIDLWRTIFPQRVRLTSLTEEQAVLLRRGVMARFGGSSVGTPSELRVILNRHKEHLYLDEVTSLSPEVARVLATHNSSLFLDGVVELSGDAARELANHKVGILSLNGLHGLSVEVAEALSRHEGKALLLDGVASLTDEVAEALGSHGSVLSLKGVKALSDDAAKGLSRHSVLLSLDGLSTISATAKQILEANRYVSLPWRNVASGYGFDREWNPVH